MMHRTFHINVSIGSDNAELWAILSNPNSWSSANYVFQQFCKDLCQQKSWQFVWRVLLPLLTFVQLGYLAKSTGEIFKPMALETGILFLETRWTKCKLKGICTMEAGCIQVDLQCILHLIVLLTLPNPSNLLLGAATLLGYAEEGHQLWGWSTNGTGFCNCKNSILQNTQGIAYERGWNFGNWVLFHELQFYPEREMEV